MLDKILYEGTGIYLLANGVGIETEVVHGLYHLVVSLLVVVAWDNERFVGLVVGIKGLVLRLLNLWHLGKVQMTLREREVVVAFVSGAKVDAVVYLIDVVVGNLVFWIVGRTVELNHI